MYIGLQLVNDKIANKATHKDKTFFIVNLIWEWLKRNTETLVSGLGITFISSIVD
ncbi:hypothetical protein RAYM_03879 [Riemerella anatipestifer RA-YM]|nr:hypothetical protein G148_1571 [Riemerella anatipestifer RA-CH-2]AKP70362.1 hypothetical protein CG09_0060 [Riemerella anatipestifer]EFT35732.1 hypothetical protein RAYM_03879 [Riemerella anatipestifer RA-YM]